MTGRLVLEESVATDVDVEAASLLRRQPTIIQSQFLAAAVTLWLGGQSDVVVKELSELHHHV
jgi:hypothetical protein